MSSVRTGSGSSASQGCEEMSNVFSFEGIRRFTDAKTVKEGNAVMNISGPALAQIPSFKTESP